MKKIVHVVGTGTIGEPLLGLFTDFRDKMGIDEVTFHKRTPLASDRAKLNHLIQRGAKLAVDEDVRSEFEKLGHERELRVAARRWSGRRWSSTAPRRATRTRRSSTRT